MIFIEDLFRFVEIQVVFAFFIPRKFQDRFDIVAAYSRLGGRWLHLRETVDFLLDLFFCFFLQFQSLKLAAESFDLILNILCDAQFLLDSTHLFSQVVFSLILVDLRFYLRRNVLLNIQDLNLLSEKGIEFFQTFFRIQSLQEFLLVLQLAFQMGCDHICHPSRLIDRYYRSEYFRSQVLVDADIVIKAGQNGAHEGFRLCVIFVHRFVFDLAHSAPEIRYFKQNVFDPSSANSFHKYANGISRQLQHLLDFTDGTDVIKIIRRRQIRFIVLLRCQKNVLIHDHSLL